MNIKLALVRRMVLVGVLFSLLYGAFNLREGHPHQEIQPPQGSNGSDYAQYMSMHQRELDAKLRVFMVKYDCTTPASWRREHLQPLDLPKLMVLKKNKTWDLMITTWNYPAPPDFWTMLLCEGQHA